jgi:hypothetical protein
LFSPTFSATLRSYGVPRVTGDRFAGSFSAKAFRSHGIDYEVPKQPKSDIYRNTLPLIMSGRVELLDYAWTINQLCGLERSTARGGKDRIDHQPRVGHDD